MDIETLYTIYVNARARAWHAYDKLADKSKADTDEQYQKALRTERRAWDAYEKARNRPGAGDDRPRDQVGRGDVVE